MKGERRSTKNVGKSSFEAWLFLKTLHGTPFYHDLMIPWKDLMNFDELG